MNTKRILHADSDGKALITCPSDEALSIMTIEQIANKYVGKPYKIIEAADVPTERTFRDAWEWKP